MLLAISIQYVSSDFSDFAASDLLRHARAQQIAEDGPAAPPRRFKPKQAGVPSRRLRPFNRPHRLSAPPKPAGNFVMDPSRYDADGNRQKVPLGPRPQPPRPARNSRPVRKSNLVTQLDPLPPRPNVEEGFVKRVDEDLQAVSACINELL